MDPDSPLSVPRPRILAAPDTAAILRRELSLHNRQVILLALGSLLTAAVLWLLLYILIYWLALVFLAAVVPGNPGLPHSFWIVYAVAAVCAIAYEWIDQYLTPNARPPDRKPPLEVFSDFVLVLPRITLSIGRTLSAWLRLSPTELTQAAALLHRIAEHTGVPISTTAIDIPEERSRDRILLALRLLQIIDLKREAHDFVLKLNPLRPESLRLPRRAFADEP